MSLVAELIIEYEDFLSMKDSYEQAFLLLQSSYIEMVKLFPIYLPLTVFNLNGLLTIYILVRPLLNLALYCNINHRLFFNGKSYATSTSILL